MNSAVQTFRILKLSALGLVFMLTTSANSPRPGLSVQDQELTIYGKISRLHLPSLSRQDAMEMAVAADLKEKNAKAMKDKKIKEVKVPELGQVEKLKLMYQAFASQESIADTMVQPTVNHNVHLDLETFSGGTQSLDHHVFGQIDNTQTTAGKIELQKMLFNLSADRKKIENIQRFVKTIAQNQKAFELLDQAQATLKNTENELMWFHRQVEEEITLFFDQVYFNKWLLMDLTKWNKDQEILEVSTLKQTIGDPIFAATWPLQFALLIYASMKLAGHPITFNQFARETRNIVRAVARQIRDFYNDNNIPLGLKALQAGIHGTMLFGGYIWPLISSIKNARFHNDVSNQIQSKMINIATYVNTMQNLGKAIAAQPELKEIFPQHADLLNLENTRNEEGNKLMEMLATNTFKGDASFFSHKGRALAAFKTMIDARNHFIKAMQAAGQIDAYLSIAKLYKKHADNQNATYCFVNFVDDAKPYLKIDNFWHPFLNPDKVVTNSIELGGNGAKDFIVTGPNAGGKSTALKSMTLAIIMAQAFGIAPASSMTMTPFAKIHTYLNIADAEGKESLFQAEMRRAQALLNAMRSLGKGEFSFVIMDEIFTGTNPKEGEAGAFGVAKNLATYKNSICGVATHFKKLTELETITNGSYKNLRVTVNKRPDGSFQCPYKLEPGISTQNIALELLQNEGFDASILDDAYSVLGQQAAAAA